MYSVRPAALCVALAAAFPGAAFSAGDADIKQLREQLNEACAKHKIRVHYPELHLCTDNGAMIAMAAAMRIQAGREQALHEYAFDVKPRWPLDSLR